MNLEKKDVCVYVKDEIQLQNVKELLEKYKENIDVHLFDLQYNFVQYSVLDNDWFTTEQYELKKVKLSKLEEILKQEL
tara:strand:- start:8492 stop:8725 length:234 start_codon:yes stop_codon:yes gene_type:complete